MTATTHPRTPFPRWLVWGFVASLATTCAGAVWALVTAAAVGGPAVGAPMIVAATGLLAMGWVLRQAQAFRDGRHGRSPTPLDRVDDARIASAAVLLACLVVVFAAPGLVGLPLTGVMAAAAMITLGTGTYLTIREHLDDR